LLCLVAKNRHSAPRSIPLSERAGDTASDLNFLYVAIPSPIFKSGQKPWFLEEEEVLPSV